MQKKVILSIEEFGKYLHHVIPDSPFITPAPLRNTKAFSDGIPQIIVCVDTAPEGLYAGSLHTYRGNPRDRVLPRVQ